jgi:hypothetical protein
MSDPVNLVRISPLKLMDKQNPKNFPERRLGMRGGVAVVTGASHGIGLACARRLAAVKKRMGERAKRRQED